MEGSLLPDLSGKDNESTSSNFHIYALRSPESKTFKGNAMHGFPESGRGDADASQRPSLKPVGSTFFWKRSKPKQNEENEDSLLRNQSFLRVPKAGSFHVARGSRHRHENTLQQVSSDDASVKIFTLSRSASLKGSLHSAMNAMRVMSSSSSNRSDSFQQTDDTELVSVVFPTYAEPEHKGKVVKSQDERSSPCGFQSTDDPKSTHMELKNSSVDAIVPIQESEKVSEGKHTLVCPESIVVSIETDEFNLDDSNDLRVDSIDFGSTNSKSTMRNEIPWGIPEDESDQGPSSVTWKKSPASANAKSDKNASSFKGLISQKENQAFARGTSHLMRMPFKVAPKIDPELAIATTSSNSLLQECFLSESNNDNDNGYEDALGLRSDESISDFSRRVSLMHDPFVDLQSKSKQNESRSKFERLMLKAKEKKQGRDNEQDRK